MSDPIHIFDRYLLRRRRDRAAPVLSGHDFLFREVAARLGDRLDDIRRTFPVAVDLGCRMGILAPVLAGRAGIETLLQCDLSEEMARRTDGLAVVADDEALPLRAGAVDLVISCLNQHWVNDLPGALLQIRRALKPDGLFLAAMFGGDTLAELRQVWLEAEVEEEGGASPRVSPFADIRDLGNLLQRAGFALPVVDRDIITVTYGDAIGLMRDLRGMGESNLVRDRRKTFTRRNTLLRVAARYAEAHAGPDGRLPATFEIFYVAAWAPHESQQVPLRPGSADVSLADVLAADEKGDD